MHTSRRFEHAPTEAGQDVMGAPNPRRAGFLIAAGMAAIVTAFLFAAKPVHAAEDSEQTNITVRFQDLDLNTPVGTRELYMRLHGAARTACGDEFEGADLTEMRNIERCQQESIERAVAQIDRPLLTALYDRHFPHEPLEGASKASLAARTSG